MAAYGVNGSSGAKVARNRRSGIAHQLAERIHQRHKQHQRISMAAAAAMASAYIIVSA